MAKDNFLFSRFSEISSDSFGMTGIFKKGYLLFQMSLFAFKLTIFVYIFLTVIFYIFLEIIWVFYFGFL